VSPTFNKFIGLFHQDILSIMPSFEVAVAETLGGLSATERQQLKRELEAIRDDEGISFQEIWNSSRSPFGLRDETGAREILGQIISEL